MEAIRNQGTKGAIHSAGMIKITTKVTLESKIFDKTVREQKRLSFVTQQAKEFKRLTQTRMIDSPAAGAIVDRRRVGRFGAGFERRHRRSARGQRPALETGTLVNAVDDRPIGPGIVEVFIEPRPNSETGKPASEYAEYLQSERLNRPIMDERDADRKPDKRW
jgi:hypothetical protein